MCLFVRAVMGDDVKGNGRDRGTEERGLEGISHEKWMRLKEELKLSEGN